MDLKYVDSADRVSIPTRSAPRLAFRGSLSGPHGDGKMLEEGVRDAKILRIQQIQAGLDIKPRERIYQWPGLVEQQEWGGTKEESIGRVY